MLRSSRLVSVIVASLLELNASQFPPESQQLRYLFVRTGFGVKAYKRFRAGKANEKPTSVCQTEPETIVSILACHLDSKNYIGQSIRNTLLYFVAFVRRESGIDSVIIVLSDLFVKPD